MGSAVDLTGRHAVVSGASRGIGEAIARAFRAAGASLHLIAEDEGVHEVARDLGAMSHAVDITDDEAVRAAFAASAPVDVLVNNAGLERITPLDEAGPAVLATFRRVLDVNVTGTMIVTRAALPLMGAGGRVINTASIWSRAAEPLFGAYVASKHATIGLTRTWARELGPRGIAVNAVCPGWVRTAGSERSVRELVARNGRAEAEIIGTVEGAQALPGGLMEPPDIVGPYLFLASPLAANITGQSLGVDRGEVPW